MHYNERYLGGCHRTSFYLANKKAGLLEYYARTHVIVVVDPIRAKAVNLSAPCFAVGV
jgi:hypothetical protein